MALKIPQEQIDSTDERIVQIVCRVCHGLLWVEKGSDCHCYSRCTACVPLLERSLLL